MKLFPKIGLMYGKSIGQYYKHYFLYLIINNRRLQVLRIKLRKA